MRAYITGQAASHTLLTPPSSLHGRRHHVSFLDKLAILGAVYDWPPRRHGHQYASARHGREIPHWLPLTRPHAGRAQDISMSWPMRPDGHFRAPSPIPRIAPYHAAFRCVALIHY